MSMLIMKSPGRTRWSCAVSNIRIRFSGSSNFMVPLLDDKVLPVIDAHMVWFIEPIVRLGQW
jgi:hypothetical protein